MASHDKMTASNVVDKTYFLANPYMVTVEL